MNADQATSALSNISPGDQLWYWLAFLGIICLLGIAVGSLIDIRRWWRDGRRQLDRVQRLAAIDQAMRTPVTRDSQQAGLDHLAAIAADQEHGHAEAATEAISMRDVVAVPALQGITACPEFCDDLTSPGDPDACTCLAACPRAWCTRRRERNPVPVEWEREGGWR